MAGNDHRDYGREARETVLKSSLTGVGITVLAVAALSPAGFGGMIGTSTASSSGNGHGISSSDPYANLPPFPNLLTRSDIDSIQGQLAATAASMEITRAATEDRIKFVRELAASPNLPVDAVRHFADASDVVAPEPAAVQTQTASSDRAVPAPVQAAATQQEASTAPAPFAPISFESNQPVDSHLELAALLLGDN